VQRCRQSIVWAVVLVGLLGLFAFPTAAQEKRSPYALPSGRGISGGNFVARNDFLDINVGPRGSNYWAFQFAPNQWGDAVFSEHFPVWTPQWGGVSSFDMEVIQPFQELVPDRLAEAKLRYRRTDLNQELQILRRVQFEPGAVRQFRITYILTNTGNATIPDLRFFQIIDFDIVDPGGDYAWYNANSDTVFMNDDRYFRIGFFGSRRSDRHSTGFWSFVLNSDWTDGELNNQDRYPSTGTTDAGVGLQWNVGDLAPGQSWELTVTFVFGGAAGIQALIPDRTVGRGREVILDASASNSVDQIVSYEWDLDNDGEFDDATGVQVRWVFNQLGQFLIHVRVRDSAGRVDTDSATITVIPDVDLTVASLTVEPSENLKDGTPTTLKAVIRNTGVDPTSSGFYVRFLAGGRFVGERFVSNLAGGGQTEVALPWRARGGVQQLEAIADVYNNVPEVEEGNNRSLLNMTPIPPADLTVTELALSPSENLVDGQQVQVTVTVTNNGADTVGDFTVRLFVDGGFFGERTISGGLVGGQSQTITVPLQVRARQRTVQAVVDAGDFVGESDEGNNSREISLPEIPLPDLTISDLTVSPAENLSHGQRVTLRATVQNIGATTLVPFRVEFQIAGETLTQSVAGLQGGQSTVVEAVWVAKAGQHTLRVFADTTRVIPESNEDNNVAERQLPEITAPDLSVTSIALNPQSGFVSGDTVTVAVTVQIGGTGRLIAPIPVILLDNGQRVGTRQLDAGLTAGQNVTLAFSWRVLPGAHTLRAVVDPDNILPEPNEENNATEQQVSEIPTPDFALNAVLVPENPFTGQPFRIQGSVRNGDIATRLNFSVIAEILDANDAIATTDRRNFSNGLPPNGSVDFTFGPFSRLFEWRKVRVRLVFEGNLADANPANDVATFNLPDVPPPDYAVTSVNAVLPPTIGYGQPVTIRINITNQGGNYRLPVGFTAGIPINVFLNDQLLGNAFVGGLDSGVETTVTFTWVIDRPVNNPTVKVILDPNGQFPDADRTNNEAQTSLTLTVERTDFVAESARIVPEGVPAGRTARVEVVVRKGEGADYTGRLPVEVFVDGVSLGTQVADVRLNANEPMATFAFNWTVTPGQARRVRVVVDPRNEIVEADETNNTLETTVDYSATAPDFVVSSLTFEPQTGVQQGASVRFTVAIRNAGAGAWASDVPVRVTFNTGFVRTFNLGNFAPNEEKQIVFDWLAVPGSDHVVTVEIDPENRVPESDETNNALTQRLNLTVAPRPILQLNLSAPPSLVGPGDRVVLSWEITNSGAAEGTATMTVSGLPDGWATVEPVSGLVPANGRLTGQLIITVPSNWSQSQTFAVTLQGQVGTLSLTATQNLRVETRPIITDISPANNQRLGSTTVTFTWRTQLPSTSEVYIKRPTDATYQRFEGEAGTFHRVVVSGLRRNTSYLFYVRSVSATGESQSEERRIFITSGVVFSQPEYSAEVRRDYDQRLTVAVINTDTRPHTVKVDLVDNPYDDAPAGLMGPGTFDEPATINPGEALTITFAAHFQDARQTDYTFRMRVQTVGEPESLTDEAIVRMRVRQPRANLQIVQIAEDPLTQVKTFRVTNIGDEPATDVTIRPNDLVAGQVGMQPLIEHAFLAPGQSIEFKIFPMLLPPGFRPFSPSDIIDARVTFENSVPYVGWNFRPFDLYILLNGVEIASLQNTIPLGVFSFPIPPQAIFPPDVGRSARLTMQPEEVRTLPAEAVQPIVQKLRSGFNLQVSYANRTQQIPVRFFDNPTRQAGGQFFIVEKGERMITQQVQATHCTNQPNVIVRFSNGILSAELNIRKSNFNDAHFLNASNFKLDICTRSFKVAVQANSETEARDIAERLCNVLTKTPPKPSTVSVELAGEGPPFKRGKPVRVRAVVTGDGEISVSTVVATFSNGDTPIALRAVSANSFEGVWIPTNIPAGTQTDQQGNLIFPVTVTVVASGCGQTATGSRETTVKVGGIQITIEKPKPEEGFRVDLPVNGEALVLIAGKVTDDENNGLRATVTAEFWFTELGRDVPRVSSETKQTSPEGSFAFGFTTRKPGELLVKLFANPENNRELQAFKRVQGFIAYKIQLNVAKDDYEFVRGQKDGSRINQLPIEISSSETPDLKEIKVMVFAFQPNEENPPRLERKPLKDAVVEIVGGGSVRTNDAGIATVPVNSRANRVVEVTVDMKPKLDVKIAPVPKAFLARPESEGQIWVFLGKNLSEPTYPQPTTPQVRGDYLVTGRRFKVTVGRDEKEKDEKIATPLESNPVVHAVPYKPPQALDVGFIEVTVTAEDITEGESEPLYRAEAKFRVFRDAFLTFHKEGFKDPEPRKVDLVEQNGLRVLPGIIEGFLVALKPGRPIVGADVTLTYPDLEQTVKTQGQYQRPQDAEVQPDAGKFRFEVDTNRPTWSLTDPVRMSFVPDIDRLANSVNQQIGSLGYRLPDFNERFGFGTEFPYLWELRYQTDPEKVRKVIEAAQRLQAYAELVGTAHPNMKEYVKEAVKAIVNFVIDLITGKIADIITSSIKAGKGIGFTNSLKETIYQRFSRADLPPGTLDLIPAIINDAIATSIRRHKGLTDEALGDVVIYLKARTSLTDQEIEKVMEVLMDYRKDLHEAVSSMVSSGLKADLKGAIQSALSALGFNLKTNNDLLDKIIDKVLEKVAEALQAGANITSWTSNLPDLVAEGLISFPLVPEVHTDNLLAFPLVSGIGYRSRTQRSLETLLSRFGKYEFQGDTPTLVGKIQTAQQNVAGVRQVFDTVTSPISNITRAIANHFDRQQVLTGQEHFFNKAAQFVASIVDEILPIKTLLTVVLAPVAVSATEQLQILAFRDALGAPYPPFPGGITPDQILGSSLAYILNFVSGGGRLAPLPSRSRQLSEYADMVNQIKAALQQNNYERVLQLAPALASASAAVADAMRAKDVLVLTAVPVAHERDGNFPASARQASQAADQSDVARRRFLLQLGSYLAAEDEEARDRALSAADEALQKTSEAMGLLDAAIQRLQSLGVSIPPLLRVSHTEEQLSETQWRINFTVTNLGGQSSPPVTVRFTPTSGIQLSQTTWSLPSLAPNASQSLTVTAQLPNRMAGGLGFVRVTLEQFDVSFVPTIVLLTTGDAVPPTITDLTPPDNATVRTRTPVIAASVADPISGLNLASLRMTLDGQPVEASYDPTTRRFSFRAQDLAEGQHTVTVEATDNEGNTSRREWRFVVNLSAPIEVTDLTLSPEPFSPDGDGLDDTLSISFRLSGDANLTVKVVDSAGNTVKTLSNEQPFSAGEHTLTWDGTTDSGEPAPDGEYTVQITATPRSRQQPLAQSIARLTRSPLSITSVSVTPSTIRLTKETVNIAFNLSQQATVQVKVYAGESTEDDGFVVRTLTLPNAPRGTNTVTWDGRTDDGRFVAAGTYTIAIEADAVTMTTRLALAGQVRVRSLPDLMPVTIVTSEQNGSTRLSAVVRNIGGETAQNVVVRFLHQDVPIGDATVSEIPANGEVTVEILWDAHRGLLTRDVVVVADPDARIDELEEFNNRLQMSVEVAPMRITHLLPEGVALVSVPIQLLDPSPQAVFGFASPEETKVAWWDPQKAGESKYRFANELPAIEPGKGYFVKLPSERAIQLAGVPVRTQDNAPHVLNLQPGWNLIGLPRLGSVALRDVRVKRPSDPDTAAIAFVQPGNPLVEPYAWTYSNAERRYQLVYPDIGEFSTLDVFKGYWVYAHEPCQLLIPAQSRSVLVTRKRSQIDGWFFRIEAEAGEFRDVVVVGKSANRMWAQKPPASPEGQVVRLSLLDEQGRAWGAVVSDGDRRMRWRLLLEADGGVEKVVLKFPDLGYLPKGLSAYLVDEATGQRRYLRTTPAVTVTFTPNRGMAERRIFQLVIVTGETGLLRIVGLKAESLRGQGVAIQFGLTRPAQTQVEVLTLTGRRISLLEASQQRTAGHHRLLWQRNGINGQPIPQGIYLVRITAVDEEGRQVQATTTLHLR